MKATFWSKCIMAMLVGITSCEEETTSPQPSQATNQIHLAEAKRTIQEGNEIVVSLPLFKPATDDAIIQVNIETNVTYGKDFAIVPEPLQSALVLPIPKGAQTVDFKLTVFDNPTVDGSRFITFTVAYVPHGYTIGSNRSCTITISDDEVDCKATFLTEYTLNLIDNIEDKKSSSCDGYELFTWEGKFDKPCSPLATPTIKLISDSRNSGIAWLAGGTLCYKPNIAVIPKDDIVVTENCVNGACTQVKFNIIREGASVINFATKELTIEEGGPDWSDVNFALSEPAMTNGVIHVSVLSYNNGFQADPPVQWNDFIYGSVLEVPVMQGATSAKFSVKPVDNANCSSDWNVTFTIYSLAGALKAGSDLTSVLTIKDDDQPIIATISNNHIQSNENDPTPREAVINFSSPSPAAATLAMFAWGTGMGRYSTVPEMVFDYYDGFVGAKNISANDTNVKFEIFPINDGIKNGNLTVTINVSVWNTTGCFRMSDDNPFTFTILDDD